MCLQLMLVFLYMLMIKCWNDFTFNVFFTLSFNSCPVHSLVISNIFVSFFLLVFNMAPVKGAAFATMAASNWNKGVQYIAVLQYRGSQMQTQSVLHGRTTCSS